MNDIVASLAQVETWLDGLPTPTIYRTNDEFMDVLVQAMNRTLFLLRGAASLADSAPSGLRGVSRYKAVPLGLLVRLAKLYEGLLALICKKQLETSGVFVRPIYETEVRLHYILAAKNRRAVIRSFIEMSYRDVPARIHYLLEKRARGPLTPIERRMLKGMRYDMKRDRLTLRALEVRKNWELDGKNLRALLQALGREHEYKWLYGPSSRFQHGSWSEVSFYHVRQKEGRYHPKLSYAPVDPRSGVASTLLCLRSVSRYAKWARPAEWKRLVAVATNLEAAVRDIDGAHESLYAVGRIG